MKLEAAAHILRKAAADPAFAVAVVDTLLELPGVQQEIERRDRIEAGLEHQCMFCGCSDSKACPGGCIWIRPNVCSRCAHLLDPGNGHKRNGRPRR